MNSQIKTLLLLIVTFSAIYFYAQSPIGITFAKQLLRKADIEKHGNQVFLEHGCLAVDHAADDTVKLGDDPLDERLTLGDISRAKPPRHHDRQYNEHRHDDPGDDDGFRHGDPAEQRDGKDLFHAQFFHQFFCHGKIVHPLSSFRATVCDR